MNNLFSLQRFVWLFNKHTKEHYKSYLISLAIQVGVLSLIIIYPASRGNLAVNAQDYIFGILLIGMGAVFTSNIFSEFGGERSSISALTLPVSLFERFAVAWVYSFVIFQLIYIASFLVISIIASNVGFLRMSGFERVNLFGDGGIYSSWLIYFCICHAITFLGAIVFKKTNFRKTVFVFLLFYIVLIIFKMIVADLMFDSPVSTSPFIFSMILVNGESAQTYFISAKEWYKSGLIVLSLISTLSLWTATYFKLKEKQI